MPATNAERRSSWLRTTGTVGLAVVLALFVAMLATNWVVVDVRELRGEKDHVVVPVPLNLLRIPLHMMPRASVRVPLHLDSDLDRQRSLDLLRALRDQAEGTIVRLDGRGGAEACRRAGKLLITVTDHDATVRVTLPFDATLALLEQISTERFEPVKALDLLASAERGELVAVDADDARIRIRTW